MLEYDWKRGAYRDRSGKFYTDNTGKSLHPHIPPLPPPPPAPKIQKERYESGMEEANRIIFGLGGVLLGISALVYGYFNEKSDKPNTEGLRAYSNNLSEVSFTGIKIIKAKRGDQHPQFARSYAEFKNQNDPYLRKVFFELNYERKGQPSEYLFLSADECKKLKKFCDLYVVLQMSEDYRQPDVKPITSLKSIPPDKLNAIKSFDWPSFFIDSRIILDKYFRDLLKHISERDGRNNNSVIEMIVDSRANLMRIFEEIENKSHHIDEGQTKLLDFCQSLAKLHPSNTLYVRPAYEDAARVLYDDLK